eukprot:3345204-Pleurochrysis_carterae.AAC.1
MAASHAAQIAGWPTQPSAGLLAGAERLPAGTERLCAGAERLSAGAELLPAGAELLIFAGAEHLPAGAELLSTGADGIPLLHGLSVAGRARSRAPRAQHSRSHCLRGAQEELLVDARMRYELDGRDQRRF